MESIEDTLEYLSSFIIIKSLIKRNYMLLQMLEYPYEGKIHSADKVNYRYSLFIGWDKSWQGRTSIC